MVRLRSPAPISCNIFNGSVPERPKGADCKSVVNDFAGPNPATPTTKKGHQNGVLFLCLERHSRTSFLLCKNLVRSLLLRRCQLASKSLGAKLTYGENPALEIGAPTDLGETIVSKSLQTPKLCPFLCLGCLFASNGKLYRTAKK